MSIKFKTFPSFLSLSSIYPSTPFLFRYSIITNSKLMTCLSSSLMPTLHISPDHSSSDNPIDFRAPPPSPIASGRRSSCFENDDVLTEFLENSLHAPDLTLPDKLFPKQTFIHDPPKIDFQSLKYSTESDLVLEILDSVSSIGCFQLVNYGIPPEFVTSVLTAALGIFAVSSEKRAAVTRSSETPYGFEEEGSSTEEEFVWGRDDDLKMKMEGIMLLEYSNFSKKMESLLLEIERIAEKILQLVQENSPGKSAAQYDHDQNARGSFCYVRKYGGNIPAHQWISCLKYDVIKMLIKGSDYSHALSLHVCDESLSEFHVYSKRGWVSFRPEKYAIVVTVGDLLQSWSGGEYKHVIGRLMLRGEKKKEDDDDNMNISMAFLYSPTSSSNNSMKNKKEKTITLAQQAILALYFTLFYNFLLYIFSNL